MEVVADVYQHQEQTQQQSQRNIQSTQTRPYSNAERQRRYREKRKADKINPCTTFSQSSDVQPQQQEQPQHDVQINKHQPQTNAERQRKYRKLLREQQQQHQQKEDINAITVMSNTQHTSSINQLQNVDQAALARKRHLNKQRQSRFRARQRFESLSASSHQVQAERFAFQNMDDSAVPLPAITNSNITSKDKVEDKCEPAWYNIYDSHLHITEETVKVEPFDVYTNGTIGDSGNNNCNEDIRESEPYEIKAEVKVEFNDEEKLAYYAEVDVGDENHTVKSEPVDISEEQEVKDTNHFNTFEVKNEIKSESSGVLGSEENVYLETLTKKNTIEASRYGNTNGLNKSDPGYINGLTVDNLVFNDGKSLKKLFICDICGKRFRSKSNLLRHILKHPKVYNCSYCSYKAYLKATLSQHVTARHTVYSCSECNYKTCRELFLTSHINAKHTKNTVFKCPYCGYETYYKGSLNQHINSVHTKNIIFNCSYCSYKAYQRSNLKLHINSVHTKSNIFNCSHCSFKTYQKGTLTKHVNAKHTKSTVFNCSECDFKTSYKVSLNRHINTKHTKGTIFN